MEPFNDSHSHGRCETEPEEQGTQQVFFSSGYILSQKVCENLCLGPRGGFLFQLERVRAVGY